jgi:aspartyl-tRNA(Asn)/glutamyl-tRNA(Gln) amidotransferase subunit B
VTPIQLAEIIDLVQAESISGKQAKVLLDTLFSKMNDPECQDPSEIIVNELAAQLNLLMDNDPVRITQLCDIVVQLYPSEVEQFVQKDRKSQFGFLTGQVIKLSQQQAGKGEANPKEITRILTEKLQRMKDGTM